MKNINAKRPAVPDSFHTTDCRNRVVTGSRSSGGICSVAVADTGSVKLSRDHSLIEAFFGLKIAEINTVTLSPKIVTG